MAKNSRPPVVTIMGHVDHGKTTLLDYLRRSRIASRESGGITQHIGAYQIEHQGKKITFIDTPGHAAFNKMRERGASITDFVVLVVAANDGVKPQTVESIRHIKEADVPVIVAINKTDLPNVYPDVIKGELAQHDILVQGFGGDIEVVEISALKGTGINNLLDTILTMSDLAELSADDEELLEAVVIEVTKDARRGIAVSTIVKAGTLKLRQEVIADDATGRVKLLIDDLGQSLLETKPGSPVEMIGFREAPAVGSIIKDASKLTFYAKEEELSDVSQISELDQSEEVDFTQLFDETPKLPLVIKSDTEGTLEAIINTLDEESVTLLSASVGEVTEADLLLATTGKAAIITFHVKVPKQVKVLAKQQGVKIRSYDVIYHLIEDLQKQMIKLLEPTIDEVIVGEAEILQIFEMRGERIAGVKVRSGEIKKSDLFHLKSNGEMVANPVIKTLMHGKQEVVKVAAGDECGMTFKNKRLTFKTGDVLIAYRVEE